MTANKNAVGKVAEAPCALSSAGGAGSHPALGLEQGWMDGYDAATVNPIASFLAILHAHLISNVWVAR